MRLGVGLWCLQSTSARPRNHQRAYAELIEDAQVAERCGFESLWLSEHHFFYDGYCPALLTAAAHALAHTQTLRIGTGMLLLPYQDASRVAAGAVELGTRSGGRLDLGVGLGYRDVEFDGKGVSRRTRARRQEAALDVLDPLAGDSTFTIWGGAQTEAGIRRAGARGYGIVLSGALPLALARSLVEVHRAAWEDAGRPGGVKPVGGALRNIWVTEDPDERKAVLDWVRASYVLYAGLGWAVAASDDNPLMDFAAAGEEAIAEAVATTIIGPAGFVAEQLGEVTDAGIDYVVCRIALEGAPQEAVHNVMRRMSERVMPEVVR